MPRACPRHLAPLVGHALSCRVFELAYAGRRIRFKAPSMLWVPYWQLA